uniref:Palmitoyltransferase n=2 Tax=Schistosoma mansoni TaxID=6183 RepID=A0A5K4F1T2_SCHMA
MVFRLDPCGVACVLITHLLVLYSDYVVVFYLVLPVLKNSFWAILNTICFNIVASLLLFSHICAAVTDPGLIPLHQYTANQLASVQKPDGWTTCNKCGIHRPPRAHHCRICRRCVRRMDHHCPWINNCVGECNQKYFIQFLIYVGILCVYALILVLICRAMISAGLKEDVSNADVVVVAHTIILVAISCLFGLFILAILSDQYKSIVEDTTAVEAWLSGNIPHSSSDTEAYPDGSGNDGVVGGGFRRKLSKLTLFREVFGNGPFYSWLLPCSYLFKPYPKYYTALSNTINDVNYSVNSCNNNNNDSNLPINQHHHHPHGIDKKSTSTTNISSSSPIVTIETDSISSSSSSSNNHY